MCIFLVVSFATIALQTLFFETHRDVTPVYYYFEISCMIYLFVDYALRFICCPSRREFFRDLINVTDGLAVYSSIVKIVTEDWLQFGQVYESWIDVINMLQLLRFLRLLRPMSKVGGFRLMYYTLKSSFHELLLVITLLGFLTLVFSLLLYYLGDRDSIKSIPDAMWFSLTTMTTVGYGDIVPSKVSITPACR